MVIVDEFTGRPDSRAGAGADGLHQAVEGQGGSSGCSRPVVAPTPAITLQNYFRMYEQLSGMTGTAVIETERSSTADLRVGGGGDYRPIVPLIRDDQTDLDL